eukprot:scaffold96777_cov63-Phaeocystis_antarctica.AAC.6
MNCGALSMCVKASAHSGDATWLGLRLRLGAGLGVGLASRVACDTAARGPMANPVAHHLWNRLERSDHRHGLALPLGLDFVGNAESATLAGPHGRAAACHWALGGQAALPRCAAQPGAQRAHPRRPGQ